MNDRILASTMICRLFSYEGALKKLKASGVDAVELCYVPLWVPHFDSLNATGAVIDDMVKKAEENEIRIPNLNGKILLEDGHYTSSSIIRIENVMHLASRLGAKTVTGNCGGVVAGVDRAQRLKDIAAFQKLAVSIAEDYGVQYCIEAPHKKTVAVHKDEIAEYWAMMDPRIKITFDPAHLVCEGEDPIELAKIYAGRVGHVHLRDAVPGNSLLHYGLGNIDFDAFIKVFNDAGYSGNYSMEFPVEDLTTFETRVAESIAFVSGLDIR